MDTSFDNLSKIFITQTELGIGWADSDGNVKYLNSALTRMLELENPEDAYEKPVFHFYDKETTSKLEDAILAAVMSEGSWTGELILSPKKSEPYPTINHLFAMKDNHGKLFSFGNVVLPKLQI